MKKIVLFFICFLLALFVIGCEEPAEEVIKISDLQIEEVADLEVDVTYTIKLTYDKSAEVDFE